MTTGAERSRSSAASSMDEAEPTLVAASSAPAQPEPRASSAAHATATGSSSSQRDPLAVTSADSTSPTARSSDPFAFAPASWWRISHSSAIDWVRVLVIVAFAYAIIPPFIPLVGPLSADDLLPLVGTSLALFILAFSTRKLDFDATIAGFAALGLLGLISATANAETTSEFIRLAGRSTGRAGFFAAMIFALRLLLDKKPWPRIALYVFASAATVEALFCLWALATKYRGPWGLGVIPFPDWSVLKGSFRVQGTFSGAVSEFETEAVSANFLAAYLVMSVPVTACIALSLRAGRARMLTTIATLLQLATLYLTYTRAALVALGAPILVIGFLLGKRKLSAAILILAIAASLAIPSVRAKMLGESHNRFALWGASLAITRDHALFGVGDGNYDRVLYSDQKYYNTPWGVASTASHNSILLSAAYHGVGGALANLLLYGLVIAVALRAMRRVQGSDRYLAAGICGALSAYLVQDQFNNLLYVPKVVTQLWFLLAALIALSTSTLTKTASDETSPVRAP